MNPVSFMGNTAAEISGGIAPISTEDFYTVYGDKEDGLKYELVDGHVQTSEKTMNDSQLYIADNLTKLFFQLYFEGKIGGTFQAEKSNELWKDHVRIPDLCYLNQTQLVEAYEGKSPVSEFVVEVVSPNDKAEKYTEKIEDYFKAGVKVAWVICPKSQHVHVYLFGADTIKVCKGDSICSAAPVLPEFALPAKDVFKKPGK